jgi:hypothetical protein
MRRADAIYGRHFPYLAGKSVRRDPSIQDPISAAPLPEIVLEGHTDLMFVGDFIALVTVFKTNRPYAIKHPTQRGKGSEKGGLY